MDLEEVAGDGLLDSNGDDSLKVSEDILVKGKYDEERTDYSAGHNMKLKRAKEKINIIRIITLDLT